MGAYSCIPVFRWAIFVSILGFSETEISNFENTVFFEEYISWFDISVDEAHLMDVS